MHLNKEKSWSLQKHSNTSTFIDNQPITAALSVRYLRGHLDKRLNWRMHLITKRTELNHRFGALFWLLRPQSRLSFHLKRLLYTTMLRPDTNYEIIQCVQNKVLRKITTIPPWYLFNDQLHHDLNILQVKDIAWKYADVCEKWLHSCCNIEALMPFEFPALPRLKKRNAAPAVH